MREEEFQRVMSGKTATPRTDEVEEGGGKVEVIVGSRGEEPLPHSTPESDYSASEREQISTAAAERGDEELSTLVKGGLKLKTHRDPPPPPPSDERVVTSAAVKALDMRKQQLASAEGELQGHRVSRSALEDLAAAQEAYDAGVFTEKELLAQQERVLNAIEDGVEQDDLRYDTYNTAVELGYVDPPVYERHVAKLQRDFIEHDRAEHQRYVQAQQEEMERDSRTMEAVVSLEERRLAALSPLAQTLARNMIEEQGEAISTQPPREMFESLAFVRNAAKLMAAEIEADHIEAGIVQAWDGPMRPGSGWDNFSRRERRTFDVHSLGLASIPWDEQKEKLARARARAEVQRDIEQSRREQAKAARK